MWFFSGINYQLLNLLLCGRLKEFLKFKEVKCAVSLRMIRATSLQCSMHALWRVNTTKASSMHVVAFRSEHDESKSITEQVAFVNLQC